MSIEASDGLPTLTAENAVARIHLNRPRQHNRFEPADVEAIAAMLDEIERDRSVRVLVVTASGPSFSAGFNIGSIGSAGSYEQAFAFNRLCDRLEDLRMPTICALNGSVYGGATDFALACDLRIGVRGSQMMMPPGRLGIQYGYGGLRRYVERLGLPAAQRLFLTAETIDAETMLALGFLGELVPPDALAGRVDALAAAVAARAPDAVRGLKASLNAIARGRADPDEIHDRFVTAFTTPNAQEGLRAWKEKRLPRFTDDECVNPVGGVSRDWKN
ncbi:enoyl-CoA hydratase/isomerase family protein [Methylobacterium aerolatum]|uniref:Enoyl-CoA hydratase/carnithine racemase n=1 Tax=Methylobacterium aerolatum TaxID=418708 RepID=A0ABU0I4P8_9HYPH|nr:enoyl-CoA hydratase/isomerase family protein [Methylobacterium aerolatum]MDQ0449589.1 enoyl-CoA hydratase/carnithine racemase [Methylobacterium aerolatum]GJD36122.1 Short-chain-enoyl-CoA hydratase [Methylobacterium aerolatum]